jgi:hypothetical protein
MPSPIFPSLPCLAFTLTVTSYSHCSSTYSRIHPLLPHLAFPLISSASLHFSSLASISPPCHLTLISRASLHFTHFLLSPLYHHLVTSQFPSPKTTVIASVQTSSPTLLSSTNEEPVTTNSEVKRTRAHGLFTLSAGLFAAASSVTTKAIAADFSREPTAEFMEEEKKV